VEPREAGWSSRPAPPHPGKPAAGSVRADQGSRRGRQHILVLPDDQPPEPQEFTAGPAIVRL